MQKCVRETCRKNYFKFMSGITKPDNSTISNSNYTILFDGKNYLGFRMESGISEFRYSSFYPKS